MVPLVLALARRHGLPLPPLLLGTVVVANAASIAVPQGNPTNLVVIERLGIAPVRFLGDMLVPGLVGRVACAGRRWRADGAAGARGRVRQAAARPRAARSTRRRAAHVLALAAGGARAAAWRRWRASLRGGPSPAVALPALLAAPPPPPAPHAAGSGWRSGSPGCSS